MPKSLKKIFTFGTEFAGFIVFEILMYNISLGISSEQQTGMITLLLLFFGIPIYAIVVVLGIVLYHLIGTVFGD